MARSQNGWTVVDVNNTRVWEIPGTSRSIRLRKGSAGYVLTHFAAWFDREVERIDTGQLDDWGWANRPIRGSSTISNHASGTAMDLNALKHPMGKSNTFTEGQQTQIRRRLSKVYDGKIRWGGDYRGRPDDMHFEINDDPVQIRKLRDKLKRMERQND